MNDPTPDDVRRELAIMKHVEGVEYTTSKRLTDRFDDASPRELGHRLGVLNQDGDVSEWGFSGKRTTYRIEL